MARNVCHSADRCQCHQAPPCAVGRTRSRPITDPETTWQSSLVAAQTWLYSCPYDNCKYEIKNTGRLTLTDVGKALTDHARHEHQEDPIDQPFPSTDPIDDFEIPETSSPSMASKPNYPRPRRPFLQVPPTSAQPKPAKSKPATGKQSFGQMMGGMKANPPQKQAQLVLSKQPEVQTKAPAPPKARASSRPTAPPTGGHKTTPATAPKKGKLVAPTRRL